jgi:hypothetical protein
VLLSEHEQSPLVTQIAGLFEILYLMSLKIKKDDDFERKDEVILNFICESNFRVLLKFHKVFCVILGVQLIRSNYVSDDYLVCLYTDCTLEVFSTGQPDFVSFYFGLGREFAPKANTIYTCNKSLKVFRNVSELVSE